MVVAPSRLEQRKARTRAALVEAAQRLIGEGRTDASIQEITAVGGVGFGSFYNHFADKRELFAAAVTEALAASSELISALTRDLTDPAEVFCVGLRLTGRLQRAHPALASVLVRSAAADVLVEGGMAASARRDIDAAIAAGRFDLDDSGLALAMTAGALLALSTALDRDPALDAAALADETAYRLLVAFGMRRPDARRLVAKPLPEPLPDLRPDAG